MTFKLSKSQAAEISDFLHLTEKQQYKLKAKFVCNCDDYYVFDVKFFRGIIKKEMYNEMYKLYKDTTKIFKIDCTVFNYWYDRDYETFKFSDIKISNKLSDKYFFYVMCDDDDTKMEYQSVVKQMYDIYKEDITNSNIVNADDYDSESDNTSGGDGDNRYDSEKSGDYISD